MDLTQKLLNFALLGAEWVMWVLVALSVISVGVMIERLIFFLQRRVDYEMLSQDARAALALGDHEAFLRRWQGSLAPEAVVAVAGIREVPRGAAPVGEAMVGAKMRQRQQLEKHLAYLGTLGNNAPFIGLFGTVLGIIKAFNHLAKDSQAGGAAVMSGISEALVATALGLLVAIPAVLTFNLFQRQVRKTIANADMVAHVILGEIRAEGTPS